MIAAPALPHADLSNWRTPPHSRWGFQHVAQFIPCATIPHGPGAPWALPPAPRSLEAFKVEAWGRSYDLPAFMDATATDALVVLLDGEIVHESYAPRVDPAAPHILMSMSKAVLGLVIGALARDGAIDLAAPIERLVPEVAGSAFAGASLRQLMDMRTGVALDAAAQGAYAAASGWDAAAPGEAPANLHGFFPTVTGGKAHGGAFAYVSANTDLLGWAIERATGRPVAELYSDLLWRPLGAEADALITTDALGAARCTGGVCAAARDVARMGRLVADGGRRDGRQVIPEAWIEDLWAAGDRQAWADGEFAPAFPGRAMRYRSGWYVIDDAPRTLFAMGVHGENLFVDRERRLVIAKLASHGPAPFDFQTVSLTHLAAAEIRRVLVG